MHWTSLSCARAAAKLALLAPAACLLALLAGAQASAQTPPSGAQRGTSGGSLLTSGSSATLGQCVTAVTQAERSVTFSGEMTSFAGTARMSMRIDLQERIPPAASFHAVLAPGLGVWRASEPKVKAYRYLKQVTNLSSPASYRALVSFRWLGARGHVIKRAERLTARCFQPASPSALTNRTPEPPSSSSAMPLASA